MIAEIRALNPKPGLAFGTTMVQPIVPDVFVRAAPGRRLARSSSIPTRCRRCWSTRPITPQCRKATQQPTDKTYLADCLQTATWLMRALDQRAKTILKVSTEIVRQQDAFFAHGVQHLRPLNLKTVADAIGMHESTVSRVTANKYMATNRGIFELKYFFTSSIASSDGGDAHSAEAVRHRIKQLIDAETADDVLSDDTIVEKLREAGIDIARRTVAKYREACGSPPRCSAGATSRPPLSLADTLAATHIARIAQASEKSGTFVRGVIPPASFPPIDVGRSHQYGPPLSSPTRSNTPPDRRIFSNAA